jgi:hypothetical protein
MYLSFSPQEIHGWLRVTVKLFGGPSRQSLPLAHANGQSGHDSTLQHDEEESSILDLCGQLQRGVTHKQRLVCAQPHVGQLNIPPTHSKGPAGVVAVGLFPERSKPTVTPPFKPPKLSITRFRGCGGHLSTMENGAATQGEGKDPSGFLSEIIGNPVTVKLNSGVVYKGESSPSPSF